MGWFSNLRTQSKLLLLFALIALVGALATGWSIYSVVRMQDQVHRLDQEAQEVYTLEQVRINFLEQELASRNYLLSGNPYFTGRQAEYATMIAQYIRRAVREAAAVDEANDLNFLDQQRLEYDIALSEAIAAYDNGDELQAYELAVGGVDDAKQLIIGQLDGMTFKRELGLQAQVQQADGQARTVLIVGTAGMLLLAGLVIVAAIATNQVAEPVQHLTNAVVAFESNAFEPDLLAGYTRRRDEIGQLARAFGGMASSITDAVRTKDQFLSAAARFIPSQYLEFLEKDSITDVRLGDHVSAEMAVMFSDIRSFTAMSERMSPQENFDFVNAYLKLVSPIIQKHNGFIVKFLGDGMMAVFPYGVDDAVQAGIEKQQQVEVFNAELQRQGRPPIEVGIGIHTGHMMVGMIGEERRIQGDAFSDNVNLTSRVEGLTKHYGVSMIVSEETLLRLEQPIPYQMRLLGKVRVQGRDRPLTLYDVFDGDPAERREGKLATREELEQGLKLYMAGRLGEARERFAAVLQRCPEDRTAALYLERVAELLAQGLPEQWEGVEVMTTK